MAFIVSLIAAFIEPFIWLNAFDRCLSRTYDNKLVYLLYILGDWMISGVRAFVVEKNPDMSVVFTILLISYITLYVIFAYNNTLMKRLLYVGILFLSSLCADFLLVGILVLFGNSVESISTSGNLNAAATLISKFVLYLITILIFRRKSKKLESNMEEFVPFIFGTVLCELPSVLLYNKISILGNHDYILLTFVFGQILLLGLIAYAIVRLNGRKMLESQLRTRLHDIEIEMSSNKKWDAQINAFKRERHDMNMHLGILSTLLHEQKYDKAREYLDQIQSAEVDIVQDFYALSNRNVAIVLSQKKKYAEEKKVSFMPEILIDNFIISDKDICTILGNMLDNAIEAAGKCKDGFVNLIMKQDPDTKGYFIACLNNYDKIVKEKGRYVSTKSDKENHGLGIDIMKRIVDGYRGKCNFRHDDSEKCFFVDVYIPESAKKKSLF